jgi:hypothetical protein
VHAFDFQVTRMARDASCPSPLLPAVRSDRDEPPF